MPTLSGMAYIPRYARINVPHVLSGADREQVMLKLLAGNGQEQDLVCKIYTYETK